MSLTLGSANDVDLRRPIGRLEWVVGFSHQPTCLRSVFSPILACAPHNAADDIHYKFARSPIIRDAPFATTAKLKLGALYYLDNLVSTGSDEAFTRLAFHLAPHAYVGTNVARFEVFPVGPRARMQFVPYPFTGAMARLGYAASLHGLHAEGVWFCHISLDRKTQLLIPCSELVFKLYEPHVSALLASFAGDSAADPNAHPQDANATALLARAVALARSTGIRSFVSSDAFSPLSKKVLLTGLTVEYKDPIGSIHLLVRLASAERDRRVAPLSRLKKL